jgi:hypothetical protein
VLDTLVPLLTAKLKLVGVAVAAAALSTSAVAITTVSSEEPLVDEAVVTVEAPAQEQRTSDPEAGAGGQLPAGVVVDEDEVVADPAAEQLVVEDEVVEEPAAPSDVVLPECPADVKNHGAYVSSVARDKTTSGREHGARVSAAAKSDCGKPAGGEVEEPAEDAAEEQAEVAEQGDVAAQQSPAPKGKGPEKAKGQKPAKAGSTGKQGPPAGKGKGKG